MRFSAITALCAAPLALAGTLHAELVARGVVGVEAGVQVSRSDAMSGSGEPGNSKSSYNSDDYEGSSSYNNGDSSSYNNGGSSSYNNGGSSSYNNGDNYDNNGNNAIVQQSNSVTEVIVIWVNYGGNSATTVVNTAQAIASATAAAATHSVSQAQIFGISYIDTSKGRCWWLCWIRVHPRHH
jgi:hypothetical protein